MRSNAVASASGSITGALVATRSCRSSMVLVHHMALAMALPSTPITIRQVGTPTEVGPTTTPAIPTAALMAGLLAALPVGLQPDRQVGVRTVRRRRCPRRPAGVGGWGGRRGGA